jgi:RNA recognition motif-containing protein
MKITHLCHPLHIIPVRFFSPPRDPSPPAIVPLLRRPRDVNRGGGTGRRVYVTNVPPDAAPERLRGFFARFGELEGGPFGFDADTGRSLGYALFVYGAAAGAATAVAEPYRVFEGRTLHCQLANEPARKVRHNRRRQIYHCYSRCLTPSRPPTWGTLHRTHGTRRGLQRRSGRTRRLQLRY